MDSDPNPRVVIAIEIIGKLIRIFLDGHFNLNFLKYIVCIEWCAFVILTFTILLSHIELVYYLRIYIHLLTYIYLTYIYLMTGFLSLIVYIYIRDYAYIVPPMY